MSYTFALSPEYSWVVESLYSTQRTPMQFGYIQTRAIWPRPRRTFKLKWTAATQPEKEYIESFFRELVGSAGAFDYVPTDPVPTPHRNLDVTYVSGGALASRTYHYAFSWVTTYGETLICTESTYVIPQNYRFKVTAPRFWYKSIIAARVYATWGGTLRAQTDISTTGGSWTEPVSGLVSGAYQATSNTAQEKVSVHLLEDTLSISKESPVSYAIEMSFEELF